MSFYFTIVKVNLSLVSSKEIYPGIGFSLFMKLILCRILTARYFGGALRGGGEFQRSALLACDKDVPVGKSNLVTPNAISANSGDPEILEKGDEKGGIPGTLGIPESSPLQPPKTESHH